MTVLSGEVIEQRDGTWRTVTLVPVDDWRRYGDPLGLIDEQRRASDLNAWAEHQGFRSPFDRLRWLYTGVATQPTSAFRATVF